MRKYDARTILINLEHDLNRMLLDGRTPKEIFIYIKRKMSFLENPPKYNRINWGD